MNHDPAQIAINLDVQLRRRCGSATCLADSGEKALAEPYPLLFVPQSSLSDFEVRGGREYNATSRV